MPRTTPAVRALAAAAAFGLTAALTALVSPACLGAQTLRGAALDETDGRPVSGALVRLVDVDEDVVVETLADDLGRFLIRPPRAGEFRLVAERLGYRPARTPLLALTTEGEVALELAMMPAPIGLEGLDVEVDVVTVAAEELRIAGIEPRDLGQRWIGPDDIQAIAVRRDVATLLEWQQIPGLQVFRSENYSPLGDDLGFCVSLQRGRTASGAGRCALVVVDGHPMNAFAVQDLDPETVEAMAVLQPVEATTLFGTPGGGGALMIWTKRGGGRRP